MKFSFSAKIKAYLDRLADSEKRPNSFLFAGAAGAGKKEAAVYFVSKLAGKTNNPEFLQKIEEKLHPDVVIVEPETIEDKKGKIREKEISIGQVREARERLKYFPYELGRKFCLVKKAERLNAEASNALLKIIEEPTEGTFFLLLSNDIDSVLPTIASRCAVLRFPQASLPALNEENRRRLKDIFKKEIYEKFDHIEKISKDKSELAGIFRDWEAVAAESLRKLVKDSRKDGGNKRKIEVVVELIGNLRESINRLEHTNASPRAVGERLVLNL